MSAPQPQISPIPKDWFQFQAQTLPGQQGIWILATYLNPINGPAQFLFSQPDAADIHTRMGAVIQRATSGLILPGPGPLPPLGPVNGNPPR